MRVFKFNVKLQFDLTAQVCLIFYFYQLHVLYYGFLFIFSSDEDNEFIETRKPISGKPKYFDLFHTYNFIVFLSDDCLYHRRKKCGI